MKNWKIEEMLLYNERKESYWKHSHTFKCEAEVFTEDKIIFIDEITNGKLSEAFFIYDKFQSEKDSLSKDNNGKVRTVSIKAWLNKNDKKKLFNDSYNYYNKIYTFDIFQQRIDINSCYDIYDIKEIVDNIYHNLLHSLANKETRYFHEHDEYSILLNKYRNDSNKPKTKYKLWEGSNSLELENPNNEKAKRPVTIDELKMLISVQEKIEKFIEEVSKEIKFEY